MVEKMDVRNEDICTEKERKGSRTQVLEEERNGRRGKEEEHSYLNEERKI